MSSGGGPMNLIAAGFADFGEVGVFPRAGRSRGGWRRRWRFSAAADHSWNIEIALPCWRRADAEWLRRQSGREESCGRPRCRWATAAGRPSSLQAQITAQGNFPAVSQLRFFENMF